MQTSFFTSKLERGKQEWGTFKAHAEQKVIEAKSCIDNLWTKLLS